MKKLFILFLFMLSFPFFNIEASSTSEVRINNVYYETLEEAVNAASADDIITLVSNVDLENTLEINKTVNINLNGKSISRDELVFLVQGGVLNLTGPGTIKEVNPNYGAIMVKGSDNKSDRDYSIVNVSGNVTLEGWSGIFVNQYNTNGYGINVNVKDTTIKASKDSSGGFGSGIYINGQIKDKDNYPIIYIGADTNIVSDGNGVYQAGYSKVVINDASITGDLSAIAIKSGVLTINSGEFKAVGANKTPTPGLSNGINASGAVLQMESNSNYAGSMDITIEGGKFISKNGYVIYEYLGKGDTTKVSKFLIKDGEFYSQANFDVFLLSGDFINKRSPFIKGGTYSSGPTNYIYDGYKVKTNSNSDHEVVPVTKSLELETKNEDENKNYFLIIFPIVLVILSVIYIIRKRRKN